FIADRVVEPAGHIAADKFNRRHAADFSGVSLPQRTVHQAAGFVAALFNRLRQFDDVKVGSGEAAGLHDHWFAGIAVDDAAHIWTRAGNLISVSPKVSELR